MEMVNKYFEKLGVDNDNKYSANPEGMEKLVDAIRHFTLEKEGSAVALAEAGAVSFVVEVLVCNKETETISKACTDTLFQFATQGVDGKHFAGSARAGAWRAGKARRQSRTWRSGG